MEKKEVWVVQEDKYRPVQFPRRVWLIGETSRSWVIGPAYDPAKMPKKTTRILTDEEGEKLAAEADWYYEHVRQIAQKISPPYGQPTLPIETLRKVAEIVGYEG